MNELDRTRFEMFDRIKRFGVENASDFPAPSLAAAQFTLIGTAVDEIQSAFTEQQVRFELAAKQFEIKRTIRRELRDQLSAVSRTAKAMKYRFDTIDNVFRFNRNRPDANLLATARTFYIESEPYETQMVEFGLPPDFRNALNDHANAFEHAFSATDLATKEHMIATAAISAKLREGTVIVRTLDGIVKK